MSLKGFAKFIVPATTIFFVSVNAFGATVPTISPSGQIFATTFECDPWNQSRGTSESVVCAPNDGISGASGKTTIGHPSGDEFTSQANYPGGGGGLGLRHYRADGMDAGGGGMRIETGIPATELWVRFYMRYPTGFIWENGKPEFTKEIQFTGNTAPDAAFGFRANGMGGQVGGSDEPIRTGTIGWTNVMGGTSGDGQWHCYEYHLKRGAANGIIQYWVDGVQGLNVTNANTGASGDWRSFILGGGQNNPTNAKDMYTDYDDLVVSTRPIGCIAGAALPSAEPDAAAPSVPTNLSSNVISAAQINLAWTASTDNVGVSGYRVFRDGVQISTTGNTTYADKGLTASTTYTYALAAYDIAGNVSAMSGGVSATTPITTSTAPTVTHWSAGQRVKNTLNSNVRASASLTGSLLGVQTAGALGTVIAGPISMHGYTWYSVNYDAGTDGWVADAGLEATTAAAPTAGTLSVALVTNTNSGKVPFAPPLAAAVAGTARGAINYSFYCDREDDGTNITFPRDHHFSAVANTSQTVVCRYETPGIYVAKVIAERGLAPAAEAHLTITVTPAPEEEVPVLEPASSTPTSTETMASTTPTSTPAVSEPVIGRIQGLQERFRTLVIAMNQDSMKLRRFEHLNELGAIMRELQDLGKELDVSAGTPSMGSIKKNLYYGMWNDPEVKILQTYLASKGYLEQKYINGNFMTFTMNAVKAFQTAQGIPATGYVGELTREKMK